MLHRPGSTGPVLGVRVYRRLARHGRDDLPLVGPPVEETEIEDGDVPDFDGSTLARAALISCCTISHSTSMEGAELAGGIADNVVGGSSGVSWTGSAIAS